MYLLFDGDEVLGVFDTSKLDEKIEEYFGSFTSVTFTDVRDSRIEWIHEIRYDVSGEECSTTLILKQYYLNEI